MSYSKTHDDFAAVLASLSPLSRRCVALLMKYIHQDCKVYLLQYAGQKKRATFAQSLMRLTNQDKTRISKSLNEMIELGVIKSVNRFDVEFSSALIRKDSRRFTARDYKVAPEIIESYSGDLLFELPKLHKGEDIMQPAFRKEFDAMRERDQEMRKEIRELREILMMSLNGRLDAETVQEVKRHLQIVKNEN